VNRLNIVLLAILAACALSLITAQHHARRLFVDLERSLAQGRQLEIDWNQLRVQQTSLATAALIDAKARRELGMEMLVPDRTLHLIRDPDTRQLQFGALPPGLRAEPAGAPAGAAIVAPRAALFCGPATGYPYWGYYALCLARLGIGFDCVDGKAMAAGALDRANLLVIPGGFATWG
jgi:cell division protein FtsL